MEKETPGFRNPSVVVPVARTDLLPDANLERSLHFSKNKNPRVVIPVPRTAMANLLSSDRSATN
jgi:hypothetical protein